MKFQSTQKGFLSLLAVILIVLISFVAAATAYMFTTSSRANADELLSTQAFYMAESGIERGIRGLLANNPSYRINCGTISGNSAFTDANFDQAPGTFSVTAARQGPVSVPLARGITATATQASVTTAFVNLYANSGRIMIDREMISYDSKFLGGFNNMKRGVDGTVATSHSINAKVSQYQCQLTSTGAVPSFLPNSINASRPYGQRTLTTTVQLPGAFVVGNNGTILNWNMNTENQWITQASGVTSNINAVSMLNPADAWAVGNGNVVLRYSNSAWANTSTGIPAGTDLYGIYAVSFNEAWAVGTNWGVFKWNGTSWANSTIIPAPTIFTPAVTMRSISMYDGNHNGTASLGWFVGDGGITYKYTSASGVWNQVASGVATNLLAVQVISPTEVWAVGDSGTILIGDGTTWAPLPGITTNKLNALSLIDSDGNGVADTGWLVGANGTALLYANNNLVLMNPGIPVLEELTGVVTIAANQAWATTASGNIYYWNGATWASGATGGPRFNGIGMVAPHKYPYSSWFEIFQ